MFPHCITFKHNQGCVSDYCWKRIRVSKRNRRQFLPRFFRICRVFYWITHDEHRLEGFQMNDFRVRLLTVILLFILFSGSMVSYHSTNSSFQESKSIFNSIPLNFEEWRGQDLRVSDNVFKILQTQSILVREYRNDTGDKVTLAVIYYPDNQISFHAPESCLGGIGYTITQEGVHTVEFSNSPFEAIDVKWLNYQQSQTHEFIYYFYATHDYSTPHYLSFRWQMLINQLKHRRTNGALIRVSTPIQPNLSPEIVLQEFLTKVFPFLSNVTNFKASVS